MKYYFSQNKRFYAGVPKHQQVVQNNKKPLTTKERNLYKNRQGKVIVPKTLFSIAVGQGLADSTFYGSSRGACVKFEYGYKDKAYRYHICDIYKDWTWYRFPSEYVKKSGEHKGQPHSYHFQTFKHPAWFPLVQCFFPKGRSTKSYVPGTITKHLCEIGLAYWVYDDGSFNKRSKYFTLHAEGFTLEEKAMMCEELNNKFNMHCYPMKRSGGYDMIYCPTKDTETLRQILHKRPRPEVITRKVPGGWDPSIDKDSVYSSLMNKIKLPCGGYESFINKLKKSLNLSKR